MHQKRADEEIERLKYLQNLQIEKEYKWKMEEDIKIASLDTMRQHLLNEINTSRTTMQSNIDEQRYLIL